MIIEGLAIGQLLWWGGAAVAGLFGIKVATSMITIVPERHERLLNSFGGKYSKTLKPGLNIKAPWPFQQVEATVSLQQFELKEDIGIKTVDNSFMSLPVNVQMQVQDSYKSHYVSQNLETQLKSFIRAEVLNLTRELTFDEIYGARQKIREVIEHKLGERFKNDYGIAIVETLVGDPVPDSTVVTAFNKVIASKRALEASQNEAQADRIRIVAKAEADADAKRLSGKGIADMRREMMEGWKANIEGVCKSTGLSEQEAVEVMNFVLRMDTLREVGRDGNLIISDMKGGDSFNATQMALLNEALAQRPAGAAKAKAANPSAG